MKFKLGDFVEILSNGNQGTIIRYYPLSSEYDVQVSNLTFRNSESDLKLVPQKNPQKFKVGDRVKIKSSTDEGFIVFVDTFSYFYHVEIPNTMFGHMTVAYSQADLELVPPLTTPGYTSSNGVYTMSLPPGFTFASPIYDNIPGTFKIDETKTYKHKCSFKTYTGLMYKEEYCDCGVTKNRRGIYE